jgi:hypothetical protein
MGEPVSGKGSSRRGSDPESRRKFEEGWARIFKKPRAAKKPSGPIRWPGDRDYPVWVCTECAEKAGGRMRREYATWHVDLCGVCAALRTVTEPRDFGYPPFPR